MGGGRDCDGGGGMMTLVVPPSVTRYRGTEGVNGCRWGSSLGRRLLRTCLGLESRPKQRSIVPLGGDHQRANSYPGDIPCLERRLNLLEFATVIRF